MANGEDRLVKIECVLQQKLVDGGPGSIHLAAFWNRIFAISLRVHVEAAARQKYPADPCQKGCNPILTLVKGDDYRRSPNSLKGGQVRRQRPLIVINVAAGGLGNGDSNRHLVRDQCKVAQDLSDSSR